MKNANTNGLTQEFDSRMDTGEFLPRFFFNEISGLSPRKMEILGLNKFCVDRQFHSVVMKKNSTQNLFQKETLVLGDDGSQNDSG